VSEVGTRNGSEKNRKKELLILILFFLLNLFFYHLASAQARKSPRDLPEKYRKWLEEEVVYIISPKEREVFLQLETDRERDIFIEAFWKQRDPDPSTPENEFKIEHYRRLNFANQRFGKDSPGPGWRSPMGRIYIMLGEPSSVQYYENESEIYPVVIWYYEGKADLGLPNNFAVVFFKRSGVGEYEIYSPIKDGPHSLLIHYSGDPSDHLAAYNQLLRIQPAVAAVSLSLIPEESTPYLSPSIASEILLGQQIPQAPYKKVKDTYAEKFLLYKGWVDVEYSANYIDNDALVKIIYDTSGLGFVHYALEPRKLTLEQIGDTFRTRLEVNVKVSDRSGRTVYQYEETIPVELNREQYEAIKTKLFSFQDLFPLVEGEYKLNILLKNDVSKEFTSLEAEVIISPAHHLQLGELILANRIVSDSPYAQKKKPFLVGRTQLVPSPRNDFASSDRLYLYFQIMGLTENLRERGFLEYEILKEEQVVVETKKKIADYPTAPDFLEEFSLSSLSPAYYKIRVNLYNETGEKIAARESQFYISPQAYLPRPWVLSLPQPPVQDPVYANIMGNQYFALQQMAKARSYLERAHLADPKNKRYALDLARFLLANKEFERVMEIAARFLTPPDRYDFLSLIGQACQALGKYEEAAGYYEEYLSHFGVNINLLNNLGECYYRLGNFPRALGAWERSLQINPKQEDIKKKVEAIKEKK